MSSSTNQIKGGALLSYLSIIIGNVIVLLYTPFMLRSLGSSEYGIYSICNTVSSAIAMLDSGFGIAAVRFIVKYKTDEQKLPSVLGTLCIINFILAAVALLIMSGVVLNADRLFGASMTPHEISSVKVILWITAAYLSLSFISSIYPAIVVANERFVFIKIVDIAKSILLPILIIPFLLHGYKAIAMSLITVIVFLMMNLAKLVYCYVKLDTKISFKCFDKQLLKQTLPFAGLVIFKLLLDRVYWSGGQFILGIVSGTTEVAILALALQLSGYYNSVALSVNNLFLPRCTSLAESNDKDGISALFIRVSRIQLFILGIFVSVFIVFGGLFVELWAGHEYYTAFICCVFIMLPYTVPLSQGIANSILQAQDKLGFQAIVFSIINIIIISFSFVLGRKYGAVGCAVVISLCILLGETLVMNIYYGRIGLDVRKFWKNLASILLPFFSISAVMYFVVQQTIVYSWGYFAVGVVIMALLLSAVSYFVLMNKEEKEMVSKVVLSLKNKIKR